MKVNDNNKQDRSHTYYKDGQSKNPHVKLEEQNLPSNAIWMKRSN